MQKDIKEEIKKAQSKLGDINCLDFSKERINQKLINEAYTILDELRKKL